MDGRIWKATIAGFVALFALGFLTYGWLLADFFAEGMLEGLMKDPPDFPYLVAGEFLFALAITLVLSWKGVANAKEGAIAALTFGVLLTLAWNLTMFATSHMLTWTTLIAGVGVEALRLGVTGAVIGMMLGQGDEA